jgi:hypothetical protein
MFKRMIALAAAGWMAMSASALADYVVKDGNGTLQTIKADTNGSAILPVMSPVDGSGNAFGVSNNPFFVSPGSGASWNVVCTSGCAGSGGTSSSFGSTFPSIGTALGISNGSNMVALTLGQAVAASSLPVALPATQITALTPPTSVGLTGTLPAFAAVPTVLDTAFSANPKASITRSANTTTYGANTGWNNGTPTFFSFTGACRANGGQVLIPRIDIWSSANPATKLTGVLYLFAGVPGTNVSDAVTFTIASADFANLTGSFGGIPFTLANSQASGAANSGTSLTGVTYQGQCASGSTTITGMVEVTNAYVPASAEVLNVALATVGVN